MYEYVGIGCLVIMKSLSRSYVGIVSLVPMRGQYEFAPTSLWVLVGEVGSLLVAAGDAGATVMVASFTMFGSSREVGI